VRHSRVGQDGGGPRQDGPSTRPDRVPAGTTGAYYTSGGNPIAPLGLRTTLPEIIEVCPVEELKPGQRRLVEWEDLEIGVFNCGGNLYAIEDRCSHDDGPLAEGEFDEDTCTVECPRHGSLFDLKTGKPMTLPAYVPVDTFPVIIEDETIKLEVE
jgi:3-phenylpropionate/trans-cinnamate dioxygenase ferredoxin component